jgi:hypothetical protein
MLNYSKKKVKKENSKTPGTVLFVLGFSILGTVLFVLGFSISGTVLFVLGNSFFYAQVHVYYCKIGSSHQPNEMLPEPGRVGLWGFDTNIKYEPPGGNINFPSSSEFMVVPARPNLP